MAKKNNNSDNLDNLDEFDNTNSQDVVEAATEKEVRVRGLKNHKCTIGTVRYIIEDKREIKLPASVASQLARRQIVIQIN